MGTRSDFYVQVGEELEWIGSNAWDGYPSGIAQSIVEAKTEEQFREAVATEIANSDSWTSPEMGWPWPWESSRLTDFAYVFHDGHILVSRFGRGSIDIEEAMEFEDWDSQEKIPFPNMSDIQKVTWGPRSGALIVEF